MDSLPLPLNDAVSSSPAGFAVTASRGQWQPVLHLLYLIAQLTKLARRQIRRLLILQPVRHCKSRLASHYFPAWMHAVRR